MSDDNKEVVLDSMPGADKLDDSAPIDFNFGLGDEPVEATVEADDEADDTVESPLAADTPEVEEEDEPEEPEEETTEAEEEPEEEVAEADEEPEVAEEPKKRSKKSPMVPKSRLDEVLAKQKALQKQLDDLNAAKTEAEAAPEEYDFGAKELEYQELLLDGESKKAAELRTEIRRAERAQIEYEMGQKMEQRTSQSQQAVALQQAAADLEAGFPVFDQNSAEFNAEYTQEVVDLRDAFIVKGDNPVAALSKAAKFVIREYDLAGDDVPVVATGAKDEIAKKRAEVSRKLKAAKAQPPEMAGESSANRGEKASDVLSLSEDEFNALPEATLKRLRGDVL